MAKKYPKTAYFRTIKTWKAVNAKDNLVNKYCSRNLFFCDSAYTTRWETSRTVNETRLEGANNLLHCLLHCSLQLVDKCFWGTYIDYIFEVYPE